MGKQNQKQETSQKNRNEKLVRDFETYKIRAVEGAGNEKKFTLSFSSEEPYDRWFGSEILDHAEGCVDLKRLTDIGCVLFNHKRDCVIGKINSVWIENNRGCAEIEFDADEESEKIYQKVKSGTLKGVSIGYKVDLWEEVMPNKQSTDGRFVGPASIAKKWTALEISIVSVPADPTVGVNRELEGIKNEETQKSKELEYLLDCYERQLQINKNKSTVGGER